MDKLIETTTILTILVTMTALGSAVGGAVYNEGEFLTLFPSLFSSSTLAMLLLGAMSLIGYAIAMIPGLNKLPVIFWVSIVAALACSPLCPYGKDIYELTQPASVIIISTVVLACAGLTLGKDIGQFKTISWRIIPVSLAVFSGTFIFAALIAQVTLHWAGTI